MIDNKYDTHLSLLERLKENQAGAWEEFSHKYVVVLKRWCSAWGVGADHTDDIVQETLLVVMLRVTGFQHRGVGTFRAWMKMMSWRCWCEVLAKAERSKNIKLRETLKSSPDAYQSLECELEQLATHELLQSSMAMVKQRVESRTWEAFYKTAMESTSAAMVAEELGMNVDAVYAARCRVQRWITQEYKRLDSEM